MLKPSASSRIGPLARVREGVAAFVRRWDKDALQKAESQALLAERRLREAIDLLPEGIVFLDAEARYILWNRRYAEIYHRSADLFAPGRPLAETLRIGVERGDYPDAEGRKEAWIAERLALLKNPGVRHEQQISDGRWIMIEERKTSEGGIIGLRVDITDMKQQALALRLALARAEAANRAKSDFLTNMSHEIRTPLNGVLGLAGVLAQGPLEPRQRAILQTIMTSASALESLLSDLLDFARLEAGRLELGDEPLRLHEVVAETAAGFRPEIEAKGLGLELDLAPIADEDLRGDPARLKQILSNLLSNAAKFTASGSVSVRVKADGAGAARRLLLQVADTGIGFEADDAERLFNRFEQADPSLTRKFGGVGLGLAICRQLAELMGGVISAEGRPGLGATFTLDLPAPEPPPRATPA